MKVRDILRRRLAGRSGATSVAGDVNAVVSANVGEPGSTRVVSSRRTTRIVQRDGRTDVAQSSEHTTEGGAG